MAESENGGDLDPREPLAARGYLERYLADPNAECLTDFSRNICRIYREAPISDGERRAAEDVISALSHNVELKVRQVLAEQLKTSKILPETIAMALACDVESVALPILEYSEALSERDLIEVIRQKGTAHCSAIARRAEVSESVSDAIVDKGEAAPVQTLLENDGARISDATYENVVVLFPEHNPIKEALAQRPDLPISVVAKIIDQVADHLRFELVARHTNSSKLIDKIVALGNEGALIAVLALYDNLGDAETMAAQLYRLNRLTPTVVVRALYNGQIDFIEFALSRLSQVGTLGVRKVVLLPNSAGFQRLYRRAGMPAQLFAAFTEALAHLLEEISEFPDPQAEPNRRRQTSALVRYRGFDNPEFEATLMMTAVG